jgi:glutamyl-tRNA synthetase
VNATYLRALSGESFVERSQEWLNSRWRPIASLVQERARTFADVYTLTDFLYRPEPVIDQREWSKAVGSDSFAAVLSAAAEAYADIEWTASAIEEATLSAGETAGVAQARKAQAPIRLAVTGRSVGPPLWESLELLGRDRTIARVRAALDRLAEAPNPGSKSPG